ncbi:zinc finger protein 544-like [Labeo rohita]|uniref:Zinc finger protein 544-like n=1 Tax=Labeo rohita TaxID=84645 RepID=A0A498N6Y3_LABRO|nr:zinc finger protein 544-like [Labeo rohita]RXN27452.1 zinc finger protein 544-like [Labeo rohita]
MDIMTKTAIEEICKIVDNDFAFLRQELTRVMSENTVLKDKMLCLDSERQEETTRITKDEAHAGSKIYRSICIQTDDGAQPSIKGIFGKEWCSSLWDRRNESREDELAIDVDLYSVSPYKHKEQEHSNLVIIKEECFEVDTYPGYTVEHNGQFPSDAQEDEEAEEIYEDEDAATTTEHYEKRVRGQKPPNNFNCYDGGKALVRQNASKNRLRKHRFSRDRSLKRLFLSLCLLYVRLDLVI